jgi:hypothetical protein
VQITITEFVEQIGKKEQLESGKSGEKSHNEGESVGGDKISGHQLEDSPPRQHSPLTTIIEVAYTFPFAMSE